MTVQPILQTLSSGALDDSRVASLIDHARRGISYATALELARGIGLTETDLPELLGSSLRTFQRRKTANGKLTKQETANLFESIRLIERTREVFGAQDDAWRWLHGAIRSLGGQKPIDLFDTPMGRRQVENVLGRIEHGVY